MLPHPIRAPRCGYSEGLRLLSLRALRPAQEQLVRRRPSDTDFYDMSLPFASSQNDPAELTGRRSPAATPKLTVRSADPMLLHTHQARPAGVVVATHGRACLLGASCRRDSVATCGNAISELRFVAFLDDDSQILIRTLVSGRSKLQLARGRQASGKRPCVSVFVLANAFQGRVSRVRVIGCAKRHAAPSCSLGGSAGHRRGLRRQRLGRGAHHATSLRTAEVPAAASEEPKSDVEEQWPAYTFAPVRLRCPSQGS